MFEALNSKLLNLQKNSRAFRVGKRHYDLGNDLFRLMLDRRLIYSCDWGGAAKFTAVRYQRHSSRCHCFERASLGCARDLQGFAGRNSIAGLP
ncbi:MAG: class I SAM-dependent methyltransferase [Cyanobacteria bacterium P01_F01_bin.53]